jgi:two-component system sensor kinase FixL
VTTGGRHDASGVYRPLNARPRRIGSAEAFRGQSSGYDAGSASARGVHGDTSALSSGICDFRDMTAGLPFAILVLNLRGLIVVANPQTAKLFGYDSDELIGKPIDLLVPDLRFDTTASHWTSASGLFEPGSMMPLRELVACRRDGAEFCIEIGFNACRFDENVAVGFIIDRTDRHELHRNRQDLVHSTRVSTMGQLASSLAHELNQPLTAILSNVQAAQRFMATDPIDLHEVREILDDIVKDDFRASEVIRRIRTVVKKGDLEFAPLDLSSVIRDAIHLVQSDAIARGTRVTLDLDSGLPPVDGDKVQLQQVMLNLILNAFDAMKDVAPVERAVSVTLRAEGGNLLRVAVSDVGHGLSADKLGKIFKPFVTSKPHGLGLGLSISNTIIDMHRGRLWAENNIDRGATFHVTLPVRGATVQDRSRQAP